MEDAGASAFLTIHVEPLAGRLTASKVTLDEAPLRSDRVGVEIAVPPGRHMLRAEGTAVGMSYFDYDVVIDSTEITLAAGEHASVRLRLHPSYVSVEGEPVRDCLLRARSQDELARCIDCIQHNDTYRARAACVRGGCSRCGVDLASPPPAATWMLLVVLAMRLLRSARTRR